MQVAIEIKPQQIRRIVGRTAGVLEDGMSETQRTQIETGDKGIQEADRIIGGDVILQPLRQEQSLVAIQAATMLHACKRHPAGVNVSTMSEFFHSLALHLTRRLACGCRTGARQSCGGHGCWLDHE